MEKSLKSEHQLGKDEGRRTRGAAKIKSAFNNRAAGSAGAGGLGEKRDQRATAKGNYTGKIYIKDKIKVKKIETVNTNIRIVEGHETVNYYLRKAFSKRIFR